MALPHIGLQVGNENVDLLSAFSIEKFDLYVEKKTFAQLQKVCVNFIGMDKPFIASRRASNSCLVVSCCHKMQTKHHISPLSRNVNTTCRTVFQQGAA